MHTLRVLCACTLLCAASALPQAQKNYKDRAEYDIYDGVAKDFAANNFTKVLAGLDQWAQKYPTSEFQDNRQMLYVQAYYGSGQHAKALEAAEPLLAVEKTFDHPSERLKLLYSICVAVQYIAEPNDRQQQTAGEAARQLDAFDKAPAGMAPADWDKARAELRKTARSAQLFLALAPVVQKLKASDCAAAEAASRKAQQAFPDSAQAAWYLGSSTVCLAKGSPEKIPFAIYQIARAAALDPAKGMVDPKWQQTTVAPYLDKIYNQYHGDDAEGMKQLKALAVQSPTPPDTFTLKSKTQLLAEKEAEFESKHPEVALWMKIKAALAAPNGDDYFNSGLKDSALPKLNGVVVAAKPECRPAQLTLAIRTPDNPSLAPEVVLKLEKPLTGKLEKDAELKWEGVATAFTKDPFLLTVETEAAKLEGLKTSACAPTVSRKR
ncbi:MAG: hypothetical protein HY820_32095 [Acidobacteria bacterium]|nr:hypothetical protein [Acidobacteriota bacterium]